MNPTTTIPLNVLLTDDIKKRVRTSVIEAMNVKACEAHTGISYFRLNRALNANGVITDKELTALTAFCDRVEGLTMHNHAD